MVHGYCQCEIHQGEKFNEGLEKHHRATRARYPQFINDPKNLINICPSCHRYKVHKDGNMKELSVYGNKLEQDYLRTKFVQRKSIYTNKKFRDPALALTVIFVGVFIYLFIMYMKAAIILTFIIAACFFAHIVIHYVWKVRHELWELRKNI